MRHVALLLAATPLAALPEAGERPYADVLAEVVDLVESGERDAARDLAAATLEDGAGLAEDERAALHFALGLTAAREAQDAEAPDDPAAKGEPAEDAALRHLHATRALAGPGALRREAIYDLGVVHLARGERLRARLLAGGGPGAPGAGLPGGGALAPPGASGPSPGGASEDPLPAAREAYLAARARLVERLRLEDGGDADTRANLELVLRRLRELDEIERQREEQEQQQQQREQEGEGEEQEREQEPDEQQEGEQESGPSEDREDGEQPPPDEEGEPEPQDEPSDRTEGDEETPAPQPPEEPAEGEEAEETPAPEPVEAERHLTREEVLRLLDRLAELEEEARALEARMRERRRVPVERDW